VPVKFCAITDVGQRRESNEDSLKANAEENLFIVADGMGGHIAGEVASKVAVDSVNEFIERTSRDRDVTWPFEFDERLTMEGNRLKTAIKLANRRVVDKIRKEEKLRGMGTTIVCLLVSGKKAYVGHVGDSRAYLLRDGELIQLTSDHSWVNEQARKGTLEPDQVRTHPFRNVITRALGGKDQVAVDLRELEAQDKDIFLLCSDGLTTMLDDPTILETINRTRDDLDTCGSELIALANAQGGDDNITVIVVENRD